MASRPLVVDGVHLVGHPLAEEDRTADPLRFGLSALHLVVEGDQAVVEIVEDLVAPERVDALGFDHRACFCNDLKKVVDPWRWTVVARVVAPTRIAGGRHQGPRSLRARTRWLRRR